MMWTTLLLFLQLAFAQTDHAPQSARAEFTPIEWKQLSDRELRLEVEKINGILGGSESVALKTLLPLLAEPTTPERIRIIVAEGLARFNVQALAQEFWETILRLAVTDPKNAGEVRAKLAQGLAPRAPSSLRPEQIEAIEQFLNDPKHREATISVLVGFGKGADPLWKNIRPDLEKNYDAQRILNRIGGDESLRFFKKKLKADGPIDPHTLKAFTTKGFLYGPEVDLILPLLHKKTLSTSSRADVLKAVLSIGATKTNIENLKKFFEDTLNDGNEDLLIALDEKMIDLVLQGAKQHIDTVFEIIANRLPTETDPLKKAVMLNHLNAFLSHSVEEIAQKTGLIPFLKKIIDHPKETPNKEEYVAILSLLQLNARFEYGRDDDRLSAFLRATKNKERAMKQLGRVPFDQIALFPETAKIFSQSVDRESYPKHRMGDFELVDAMVELHASTLSTRNDNNNDGRNASRRLAFRALQEAIKVHPSALTDQAALTLANYNHLPAEQHHRVVSIAKNRNHKLAERAFVISQVLENSYFTNELVDSYLSSKDKDVIETAVMKIIIRNRADKYLELLKSADTFIQKTAFNVGARSGANIPREISAGLLDSPDVDTAQMATRQFIRAAKPLSQEELTKIKANLARTLTVQGEALAALNQHSSQLTEFPKELLDSFGEPTTHIEMMQLIRNLGPKAANAAPALARVVQPGMFDLYARNAIVSLGKEAKPLVTQLRELQHAGDQEEIVQATIVLNKLGEDISAALPRIHRYFVATDSTKIRLFTAELYLGLPEFRERGAISLLHQANAERYYQDTVAKIFESNWNDDLEKVVTLLQTDKDPAVATAAKQILDKRAKANRR